MDLLSLTNKIDKTNELYNLKEEDLYKNIINGKCILHLLASRGNIKIINKILNKFKKYNPYSTDDDGNTLFHHLFYNGFYDVSLVKKYKKALSKINNDGISVIRLAVDSPDVLRSLVDLLIEEDTDSFTRKSKDRTSLVTDIIDKCDDTTKTKIYKDILFEILDKYVDVNDNNYLLFYCLDKNNTIIFSHLFKKLKNKNIKNQGGIPLISYAILSNNEDVVSLICNDNDVNINIGGPESRFIPMNLCLINGNIKIMRILISKLPDINIKDRFHNTVLHNFLIVWENDNIPIDIMMYVVHNGDINSKNFKGETPLHIMIKKKVMKHFINIIKEKNPDLALSDNEGKNAFAYSNDDDLKLLSKVKYSINLNTDEENINWKNNDDSNHGLFNSDIIHSMIYTLVFLEKYENLCIPYQSTNVQKKNLDTWRIKMYKNELIEHQDTIWTLVDLYNNMFYNLLPHVIIWHRDGHNYVDKNFCFYVRKCLKNTARFILIKLTLVPNSFTTHANMIIYDKKDNKVIRFEPYGVNDIVDGDKLDNKMKELFNNATESDVKYVRPADYLTGFNWQTISHDSESEEKILGDPVGYCLAWCYWFIELKLENPDIDESLLMEKAFSNIEDKSRDIGNKYLIHIRNFASKLDKRKNEFMDDINIPNLAKYHTTYMDKNLNVIIDSIKMRIKENARSK